VPGAKYRLNYKKIKGGSRAIDNFVYGCSEYGLVDLFDYRTNALTVLLKYSSNISILKTLLMHFELYCYVHI